jgi:UDP-N-acetylmuramoyl-L-alanyl-D-glutamate--2,6-diaminopimelate ligase
MGEEYSDMKISLPGQYSVNNALAAIAACHRMGTDIEDMREPLSKISVNGRCEPVFISQDYSVIIDYAHNGSSLINLIETMRQYNPGRILCLFGSVGGRAQLRRKEMGTVSGTMCDLSIITTDDPNFEDPEEIIIEISKYVEEVNGEYVAITDRQEAIEYAVDIMKPGDMLILAGKGHERIMKVKGEEIPIDERECVLKALRKRKIIV